MPIPKTQRTDAKHERPESAPTLWVVRSAALFVLLVVAGWHGHKEGAAIFCAAFFLHGALYQVCRAIDRNGRRP